VSGEPFLANGQRSNLEISQTVMWITDERALSNFFEVVRLEPMRPALAAAETDRADSLLNVGRPFGRIAPGGVIGQGAPERQ
jgi:hypothetical protein